MTKTKTSSITIRDVARQAGVSVATVSRYINRSGPVSADVAARLETVMAELQYAPHASARALATNKTHTIGLLLRDIGGDFFAPLLNSIEETVSEAGYDLLISCTRFGHSPKVGAHNSDGLLVFADGLDAAGIARFYRSGFPLVLIHQTPPEGAPVPCVTVENKSASRQIVEHLIQVHGCRRIIFLSGPPGHEDSHWRERGYRQALDLHGLAYDPHLAWPGEFDRRVAYASIQSLLASGTAFDAVFAGDDEAAVGALMALREAGLRVPQDVAVVGFDDQPMAAFLTPPLTTVRAPTSEVGRTAAQQLIRLIRTGQAEPLTLLPTEIVLRASCDCGLQTASGPGNSGDFRHQRLK